MKLNKLIYLLSSLFLVIAVMSCSKTKSYSEMLREEERAVNWYMANQRIINSIPADSVFEYGENAPFYKMDNDGYIYMQVINPGNLKNKAKSDQLVFFRYLRTNILDMYNGYDPTPSGNASDVGGNNSSSFRFQNLQIKSSYKYGSGVQLPLHYLGLDCEVNMVIRSYYGFSGEVGQCQPFIFNLRYFPAQF